MPLIPYVGRKKLKMRLIIFALYFVLCAGALSMIYPFLLMMANSITSYADYQEFRLIPRYLYNKKALFKKYIVDKVDIPVLGIQYKRLWYSPGDIKLDLKIVDHKNSIIDKEKTKLAGKPVYKRKVMKTVDPLGPIFRKNREELETIIKDWREFLSLCPNRFKFLYYIKGRKSSYSVLNIKRQYWNWLENKFGTINAYNTAYAENLDNFSEANPPYENAFSQRWILPVNKKYLDWQQFKQTLPQHYLWVISAELAFQRFLRDKYPDLIELVKVTGIPLQYHAQLTLAKVYSHKALPKEIYTEFVKTRCPVIFLRLSPKLSGKFRNFLAGKYKLDKQKLNEKYKSGFTELCPMDQNYSGQANDWIEFMESEAPVNQISFHDPMFMYQDFLKEKYQTIENINKIYGWQYKNIADIILPAPWMDIYSFRKQQSEVFRKYLFGNYVMVFNVIAVHGRALLNTVIYVGLAILASLTINPLAAYALSRYKLPYTNKILLFLLATMAFPPSVGMIPGFLLLKNLNLLNTYGALVLPGLANGYTIFLLKGFFDSLPDELFEAASIDGASEFSIFLRIALPMTKPILAISALGAFTSAYSAFMFAFLTCQSPTMWTLMVFLYEFQQSYPNYLVMASLVIAAIPTLVVFIFCQRIILRGIVIPTFK